MLEIVERMRKEDPGDARQRARLRYLESLLRKMT